MPHKKNVKPADPHTMMRASAKANANHAQGYFYGNLGDSIERRLPDGHGAGMLGGGHDGFQGTFGPASSYSANGPGNYYGTGLLNGVGRMFSSVHSQGGAGGFQYVKRFSSNDAWNHQVIAMCTMAYLGYGVVSNIIDLYADFATEGINIYHPDKSVRNFYKAWAKKVCLKERVHSMFINLFISGNTFVHRRWARLSDADKRNMKRSDASVVVNDELFMKLKTTDRAVGKSDDDFVDWFLGKKESLVSSQQTSAAPKTPKEEHQPENKKKRIPWGYTFLNPLQMEVRGSRVQGSNYWVMTLDKKDTLELARGMGLKSFVDIGKTEINLPKEFVNRVSKYQGPGGAYAAEVKLDREELSVVQRPGKFDWFAWGVPFVFPALRALSFKDCLRNMEAKACQSVMNALYLFKLGALKDGFPAEDEHFERFSDMLQMPANVGYVIWNDLIEGEVLQPDVAGIFDPKKHESADRDILQALGVPDVLLGGKGGNFSNSFIAVAGVLEKLESYREEVREWLMGEVKVIADAMGFRKLPEIKFERTTLRDEKARHAFLLALYDRNVLSADNLLDELDTDIDTQEAKKKEEKDLTKKGGLMERKGPFDKPDPVAKPGGPPGAGPTKKSNPKTPNGRPSGTSTGPTGKQDNPRGPKGQNVAEVLELNELLGARARGWLDQIEGFCNERIVQNMAQANPEYSRIQHVKQLKKADRERLENLIYNVFSHMPLEHDVDTLKDDFIVQMLQSDAAHGVKADVLTIYTDKIAEYSKTYGKSPSRELRRQFMVSAWTQQAIMNII